MAARPVEHRLELSSLSGLAGNAFRVMAASAANEEVFA